MPPAGIEPASLTPQAKALSVKLRGLGFSLAISVPTCQFAFPLLSSIVVFNFLEGEDSYGQKLFC